jgi:hypothetical protein
MSGGSLPFTGSLLTLPLMLVGMVLSVAGWVTRRMSAPRA